MNRTIRILATLLLAFTLQRAQAEPPHGVVLLYHHVSDRTPASTSVTPAQFSSHLEYLEENDYRVWSLQRLLDAVLRGIEEVPERVVAITFDDAYESVFTQARPKLAERDWPYTVFVNTDAIDAGHSPYMEWAQIKTLHDEGVAIENHSASHAHMSRPDSGESRAAWRDRVGNDIARARTRIAEETGRVPTLFAYPYGEDSGALAEIVAESHDYGLAQRSGPVGPLSDPLSVPRFPMATGFDSVARVELAVRSRPLPVASVETVPDQTGLTGDIRAIRLVLSETAAETSENHGFRTSGLNCFAASGRRLDSTVESDGPVTVRVDVHGVGVPGRNKVNCTAPAEDGSGDFFWYSWQWLVGVRTGIE